MNQENNFGSQKISENIFKCVWTIELILRFENVSSIRPNKKLTFLKEDCSKFKFQIKIAIMLQTKNMEKS